LAAACFLPEQATKLYQQNSAVTSLCYDLMFGMVVDVIARYRLSHASGSFRLVAAIARDLRREMDGAWSIKRLKNASDKMPCQRKKQ